MRATVMCGGGDARIEQAPDAGLLEATDALIRVARACICDSDLWPCRGSHPLPESGLRMGREAIGVAEAFGPIKTPREALDSQTGKRLPERTRPISVAF